MNLPRAAVLIALLGFGCFGQEAFQQSDNARNPCDWNGGSALATAQAGDEISQSGKAKIELFPPESRSGKSKCDFLSLASRGAKPLAMQTRKTSNPILSGDQFRYESASTRSVTASAINSSASSRQTQGPPDSASEAQELAKKLANPVASLISLPLQSNFDFGMGAGSGWRYTLNVQPVIPISLSPNWNLISRTIVPIIHQGNVTGPNTSQSGLGDTVQSLFFSPNKTEPFIWAVGPVILIPTATDSSLGAQQWGLGPTVLALKQKQGWTYGVLANHIWSVSGKANRGDVNATFLQPFLSYTSKHAWTYTINTESTYDWVSDSWSVPIIPNIAKLVRFGKQPISFGGGVKCWAASPAAGPDGCGLRFIVTALFPKK